MKMVILFQGFQGQMGQTSLIIIDGAVANHTTFDLAQIGSITVLKDAMDAVMPKT